MRAFAIAVAVGLLTGCVTSVQPISSATPVEASKMLAFQSPAQGSSAEIVVVRDRGAYGSGCDVALFVNGRIGAYVGAGRSARFYVPAGPLALGVAPSGTGLCVGSVVRTIESAAVDGQVRNYRISMDMQGLYIGPYVENHR